MLYNPRYWPSIISLPLNKVDTRYNPFNKTMQPPINYRPVILNWRFLRINFGLVCLAISKDIARHGSKSNTYVWLTRRMLESWPKNWCPLSWTMCVTLQSSFTQNHQFEIAAQHSSRILSLLCFVALVNLDSRSVKTKNLNCLLEELRSLSVICSVKR